MESNSLDETIPIEESTIKQSSDDKILNFIYYEEPQNIIQQSKETEKKYYQLKKICVDLLHKKVITTNDFEIIGITENPKTCIFQEVKDIMIANQEKYDRPYINGKRLYARLLIRKIN